MEDGACDNRGGSGCFHANAVAIAEAGLAILAAIRRASSLVRSLGAEDNEVGIVVAASWTHYEIFPRYGCEPFGEENNTARVVT